MMRSFLKKVAEEAAEGPTDRETTTAINRLRTVFDNNITEDGGPEDDEGIEDEGDAEEDIELGSASSRGSFDDLDGTEGSRNPHISEVSEVPRETTRSAPFAGTGSIVPSSSGIVADAPRSSRGSSASTRESVASQGTRAAPPGPSVSQESRASTSGSVVSQRSRTPPTKEQRIAVAEVREPASRTSNVNELGNPYGGTSIPIINTSRVLRKGGKGATRKVRS
jgi:hypothetical protein